MVESPRVKLAALTDFKRANPSSRLRNNPKVLFSQGANYVAARKAKGTSLTGAPGDLRHPRIVLDSYVDTDVRKQVFFLCKRSFRQHLTLQ